MTLILLVPVREDYQRSRRQLIRAVSVQASATKNEKELLTATEKGTRKREEGGLVETLLFPHYCADSATKHLDQSFKGRKSRVAGCIQTGVWN